MNKLKHILEAWIALFDIAPDNFALKGNYLLEEDKYEKNYIFKK